jgi:uncharacterized SAM-binding protein YcdF (DUF218 family)
VLIAFILWNLFSLISGAFGKIGRVLILILLAWAFFDPANPAIGLIGQILLFPLKPLGLSLVLLVGAGGMWGHGKAKNAARQLTIAFLVLLLSSVPIVAYWMAQQSELGAIDLERRLQRVCEQQCPAGIQPGSAQPPQAIIVMGQGPRGSVPYLTQAQTADTSDRLIYAAQLYKSSGSNPFVIISTDASPTARAVIPTPTEAAGGSVSTATPGTTTAPVSGGTAAERLRARALNAAPGGDTTPGTVAGTPSATSPEPSTPIPLPNTTADESGVRALLTELGVPGDRIYVEPSASDVYNSAVSVKRRLDDLQVRRVVVVAPVLTSRRVALSFNQLGIEATPRSADTYIRQLTPFPTVVSTTPEGTCSNVTLRICNLNQLRFVDFIPNPDALALTSKVWEEFLLSIYYFLRGWLSPLV